ncbi:transcriptional regulator with XRE-family HTH domain [Saccharopolyspora lacisalsi]|uniref:Transcriptional regulator with XRE-family HTH domain n=1 Tax=Halosaccharopolyspora lacisalsi TaxID=1000566 RepID=A0A839DU45_9PSEU|nr:helix-turn-helix transcriptional regulator [Halosaccharopolyspora lacisalsi]MBA8823796.1 transcriptional regulator with XRE-family HTH domain [Halosaccharopolyspora lacisalsi]
MSAKRQRLVRRRQAVGLTQEDLAGELGVERSTVFRWESGQTQPVPVQQPLLARLLDVSLAELAELLLPEQPSDPRLEHAQRHPSSVDSAVVSDLQQRVCELDDQYDHMPSTALLADTGRVLGHLRALAREPLGDSLQRELRTAEASAATLMGQLVWDSSQRRDQRTAREYFRQAIQAARENGDSVAEGHAALRTSYLALYGDKDPVGGLCWTERAATVACTSSDVLTGLAHLHSAEAHAMRGDANRCDAALAAAETSFARIAPSDPAAGAFSSSQFDRLAGSCSLFLGEYQQASRILGRAATARTAASKSRAIVLGNLSLAYMHQRELEAATHTLHEAMDVLETTRGGGGLTIVFDAGRKLGRWRTEPVVRDVHDRLLGLMTLA